ncbi:hypothetical protein PPERSA_01484 [Pseudocohnilembus persalinus]|uniref:Hydantoinase B/oxoprolinase domain-containing protein n=1 Tax=Pseudocohnilembus persalinus TaxID=266149 RepID=A0A0V0QH75_PSEPJ|nr:hypothetical protein PPERSA_01484 [Pseudocohnilembus persalinus]|eukprot:KRX01581.1 hypothetical protein PPERSA_01484 [Pseudocohnilembus persalinus]
MTNTRITDPEILERKYPVYLEIFQLRKNSGGRGQFHGGEGVERLFQFLQPMKVSILSERRVFPPQGIKGGKPGQKGYNHYIKGDKVINLGSKNTVDVQAGEKILIVTPGGGGYGLEEHYQEQLDDGYQKKQRTYNMGSEQSFKRTQNSN